MDLLNKYENHWTNVNITQLSRMQMSETGTILCMGSVFITISTLSYAEAPPTLSETIFKEQKENPSVQEHLLSIQLFCLMISSGDMVIWPETEEYAWGTEIAEWALLSPHSEDPSPLIVLLCTVCFHTGCGGVESVPLNGSQWMALCQTWVTFFFASGFLHIISFENLA